MTVDQQSPLLVRLAAWSKERFPPAHGVMAFVFYGSALLYGRSLAGTRTGPIAVSLRDAWGYFAALCFFLMLRVFDEHKDYEQDLRNHPQRVLQSGLITLQHLKVLGVIAVSVQIAANIVTDGGVGKTSLLWIPVIVWSCLMAKEFFIGEWLNQHLVLYGVSHMVVMPMAIAWMAQFGALDGWPSWQVFELGALGFLSGATLEVARKIRAPEDERPGVETYSKSIGPRGAPLTATVFVAVGIALVSHLLMGITEGKASPLLWAVLAAAALLPWASAVAFLRAPSSKGAKQIENAAAVQVLVSYVALITCIAMFRGIRWQ